MSVEAVEALFERGLVADPGDATEEEIYLALCRGAEAARELGKRIDPDYAATHPVRYDIGRAMARRIYEMGGKA